jgi:hypothetical protein
VLHNDFIELENVYPTMAEILKIAAVSRRKDPAKHVPRPWAEFPAANSFLAAWTLLSVIWRLRPPTRPSRLARLNVLYCPKCRVQ